MIAQYSGALAASGLSTTECEATPAPGGVQSRNQLWPAGISNDVVNKYVDEILANDKFKELSKQEYASFSAWMDKTHADWRTTCGLVSEINPETGRAEFVPPGMYTERNTERV